MTKPKITFNKVKPDAVSPAPDWMPPPAAPAAAAAPYPNCDMKFAKETRGQWVYDILFGKIPVGTVYLPKIIYQDRPADVLTASFRPKS